MNFSCTHTHICSSLISSFSFINIMDFRFYMRMCSVLCVMINIKNYSFCTPKRQDKRDKDNVMCQHLSSLPIYSLNVKFSQHKRIEQQHQNTWFCEMKYYIYRSLCEIKRKFIKFVCCVCVCVMNIDWNVYISNDVFW